MKKQLASPIGSGLLIVRFDVLNLKRGRYYLYGKRFTGVAMEFNDTGLVTKAIEYKNGKARGDYVSTYFPEAAGCPMWNADYLEVFSVYEVGYEIDTKGLSLVYDFGDLYFASTEGLFDGKMRQSSIEFNQYNSNNIVGIEMYNRPLSERYDWDFKGRLHHVDIIEKKPNSGSILFQCSMDYASSNGKLNSLMLEGIPFERLAEIKERLAFCFAINKSMFRKISANKRLCLFGDAIDDEVFLNLCARNGLRNVEELVIRHTSITVNALLHLKRHKNLKTIDVDDMAIPSDMRRTLTEKFSSCEIIYDKD